MRFYFLNDLVYLIPYSVFKSIQCVVLCTLPRLTSTLIDNRNSLCIEFNTVLNIFTDCRL